MLCDDNDDDDDDIHARAVRQVADHKQDWIQWRYDNDGSISLILHPAPSLWRSRCLSELRRVLT